MVRQIGMGLALAAMLVLGGCQTTGQNVYDAREVGKAREVKFATVLAVREVEVKGSRGTGTLAGAAAGGIGSSAIGQGRGQAGAILAGVLLGGIIGALFEEAVTSRTALEYTLVLDTGSALTVVQDRVEGNQVFQPGDRVLLQSSGPTHRVLAASHVPDEAKRPKSVTLVD
jgi:outer membrane lipoprotein SlyB